MSAAQAWVEARVDEAPPRLRAVMLEALPADSALSAPDALAEAALSLYARVIAGSGRRDDALALLAADALFTHAFQAQSELDHERLLEFAARWGPGGRLAELAR